MTWILIVSACVGTVEDPGPPSPWTEWVGAPSDGLDQVAIVDLEGDESPELFFGTRERGYLLDTLEGGIVLDLAVRVLDDPALDPVGQPAGVQLTGVGDLDGDGHEDVLLRERSGQRVCWTDPAAPFAFEGLPCIAVPDPQLRVFTLAASERRVFLEADGRARLSPVSRDGAWSLEVSLAGPEADAAAHTGRTDLLVGSGEELAWLDAGTGNEPLSLRRVAAEALGASATPVSSWSWSETVPDATLSWGPFAGPEMAEVEGWVVGGYRVSGSGRQTWLVPIRPGTPDLALEPMRFELDFVSSILPGDFDGDGDEDLLVTREDLGLHFFFAPFEDRTYSAADADVVLAVPEYPRATLFEDVDNDGLPDLFLGHVTSNAGGAGSGAVRMIRGADLQDLLVSPP